MKSVPVFCGTLLRNRRQYGDTAVTSVASNTQVWGNTETKTPSFSSFVETDGFTLQLLPQAHLLPSCFHHYFRHLAYIVVPLQTRGMEYLALCHRYLALSFSLRHKFAFIRIIFRHFKFLLLNGF